MIHGRKTVLKICNNCIYLGKQKKSHSHICCKPNSRLKAPFPHGGTREACNLYEPRYPSVAPQIAPEGMRFIEDLRGKKEFRDSEFWIIGVDPNLDCYPDDFFENKFSIAVNLSCVAFPESTFFCMTGREELEWMISEYPDCLKKMILPLEHIPSNPWGIGRWQDWGLEPIYLKPEDNPMPSSAPDYESTARRILSDGPCNFVLVRTVVHLAVFAAAVLGARKIILVGSSHKASKGRAYAHSRGMDEVVSEDIEKKQRKEYYGTQTNAILRLRRDTIQLARAFEKYGIEIMRHRYDEDINEFVFEEI